MFSPTLFLLAAKVRESLAVTKRTLKKMDMERFNLKKLNEDDVNSTRLQ
jgi:hypothetical protein